MKYRTFLITGLISFLAGNLFAGPIEKGIEFNEAKMYETSKAYLLLGIQENATAEAYYYLGDTYLMLNKEDSASYCFRKSLEINPDYTLTLVGEGKLLLKKNDAVGATELFNQATKKDKKNPAVYTAIASAYTEYNQFDKVMPMIDKARGAKKNYPGSFIAEGDLLLKQNKASEACARYSNATYFDPKNKLASLREAQVYKNINTDRSLEILDNLTTNMDPDYIPAYVEYADIYYSKGYFKKAIPVYEKFVNEPGINTKDIEKYATVLYFSQEYMKSLDEIRKVQKKDLNNFIMKRLELYNNFDLGNNDTALNLAQKFFASKGAKDEYISQDYSTYARLLAKDKQDSIAIGYFQKALELDTTKVDLYKELSSSYEKIEKYPEAIASFQKFMDSQENPNISDYYLFGKSYYQAAGQMGAQGDTIVQKEYFLKANSLFNEVIKLNPDHYLGYLWSAYTLASLDPELKTGLAKPMYEQALEKLLAANEDGKRNKDITGCYIYLGNYYLLVANDKPKALEFLSKALEFNPTNKGLEEAINEMKKK